MSHDADREARLSKSRYLHLLTGPRGHLAFDSLAVQGYDISSEDFLWLAQLDGGKDVALDERARQFLESGLIQPESPGRFEAVEKLASARRQRLVDRQGRFTMLRLAVTERCNMACTYCFQQRLYPERQPSMTHATLVDTLTWFIEQGAGSHLTVQYFGGEPLLEWASILESHALLSDALACGTIPGFRETVTTNGTLLNRHRADWMVEHGFDVTVSFDGPPAENDKNRLMRSGRGSFRLADAGLRRWIEAGGKPAVLMTASRESLAALPEYVRWFIEEADVRPEVIGINSPQPTTAGWETGGVELAEVIWRIWRYCDERGVAFHGPGTFVATQLTRATSRVDTCVNTAPGDEPSWPIYVNAQGERSMCVVHHQDRGVMPREGESSFEAGLRWHNNTAPMAEECDRCIASQICGGPCAIERLLWGDRLSVDRCGLMRRMTELVLTEG